jgi:membrane-associated phospholipid phosphatase
MNHLQGIELQGIFMREAIDSTLNSLEGTKRDAFPSGHTAIALMVLFLANKYQKRLYKAFLPLVIAMIISTVYLRYHYVVDVIGGALLFIFTAYIGERYYNYWEKRHSLRVKLTSCRGKGQ